MKLPTDAPNETGEPGNADQGSSGNVAAEGTSGSETPVVSASGASGGSAQPGGPGRSGPGGNPDEDFSEYLWMENEEEFDSQVLQELEDEEMINYYYELYEASLNENGTFGPNTANIRVSSQPPPPYVPAEAQGSQADDAAVDSLAQGISNRLNFSSRLNPEAAEFVPRTSSSMNSTSN